MVKQVWADRKAIETFTEVITTRYSSATKKSISERTCQTVKSKRSRRGAVSSECWGKANHTLFYFQEENISKLQINLGVFLKKIFFALYLRNKYCVSNEKNKQKSLTKPNSQLKYDELCWKYNTRGKCMLSGKTVNDVTTESISVQIGIKSHTKFKSLKVFFNVRILLTQFTVCSSVCHSWVYFPKNWNWASQHHQNI